jgi:hypothetical protein
MEDLRARTEEAQKAAAAAEDSSRAELTQKFINIAAARSVRMSIGSAGGAATPFAPHVPEDSMPEDSVPEDSVPEAVPAVRGAPGTATAAARSAATAADARATTSPSAAPASPIARALSRGAATSVLPKGEAEAEAERRGRLADASVPTEGLKAMAPVKPRCSTIKWSDGVAEPDVRALCCLSISPLRFPPTFRSFPLVLDKATSARERRTEASGGVRLLCIDELANLEDIRTELPLLWVLQ